MKWKPPIVRHKYWLLSPEEFFALPTLPPRVRIRSAPGAHDSRSVIVYSETVDGSKAPRLPHAVYKHKWPNGVWTVISPYTAKWEDDLCKAMAFLPLIRVKAVTRPAGSIAG